MYLPTGLTALAAATPYFQASFPEYSINDGNIMARSALSDSSSCAEDGRLLCNGPYLFGVCSNEDVVWQPTAGGTICSCNQDHCIIVAGDDDTTVAPSPPTPPNPTPSTTSSAAPAPSPSADGVSAGKYIKTYLGNGSPSEGWPKQSDWLSFDELWSRNLDRIKTSCEEIGQENNSPQEINEIKSALIAESDDTKIDARFALAALLQESGGCVRVKATSYSVRNPGLYQSHDGTGCYGEVPCPESKIRAMVRDGLAGTDQGDGFLQCIQQSNSPDVQSYYQGARRYNSGSIAPSGNLEDGIATTHCYVSDIANRLLGWSDGPGGCTLDDN